LTAVCIVDMSGTHAHYFAIYVQMLWKVWYDAVLMQKMWGDLCHLLQQMAW